MLLSYLSFLTFLSCTTLGIRALLLDPGARLNRAFSMISTTSAIWAFGYIFIYIESDTETIWFWYRFAAIGGLLLLFATFNFLYVFADLKGAIRRVMSALRIAYLLFLLMLMYVQLTGTMFVVDFVRTPYGNAGVINKTLPGYYLINIAAAICFFSGIVFLIAGRKNNSSRRYKLQMKWLVQSTGMPVVLIALSNFILPVFTRNPVPFVGIIFLNITVVGVYYLIASFKLMRIGFSALKPEDVVSHISDMVLLLDMKYHIVIANEAAGEVLSVEKDLLKDAYFPGIVRDDDFESTMKNFLERNDDSLQLRLLYGKNGSETVLTDTYISGLKDKFSDIIGILIISKEVRGRKEFQIAYGISAREMEVLDFILTSHSARSIGEILRISQRTVETHLINIYNKAGINTKPELFSLCAKFNLIP